MSSLAGALLVAVAAGSVLVLFVAGRKAAPRLIPWQPLASTILSVSGTTYAVLLAFAVFVVWSQYEDVKIAIDREAAQLVDVARLARTLPEASRAALSRDAEAYASQVLSEEWSAMTSGRSSPGVEEALRRLWETCERIEPSSERERIVSAELVRRLVDIGDARRQRVHASRARVPPVVRVVLWFGGAVTLVLTLFLVSERSLAPAVMAALLVAQIASILFLVLALDSPFTGAAALSAEPFGHAVEWIRSLR